MLSCARLAHAQVESQSQWQRDVERERLRTTPARFSFKGAGGDWEISHPPTWMVSRDPKQKDTYIFISRDGQTRLLLARRALNPRIKGEPAELEERNLATARALGGQMAKAARSSPRFVPFQNITCRGLYYRLVAKHPRPGDLPYVVGLSAVKGRYTLMGYFQYRDRDMERVISAMIQSISFGPPPRQ